jgi:hypothetical protein
MQVLHTEYTVLQLNRRTSNKYTTFLKGS